MDTTLVREPFHRDGVGLRGKCDGWPDRERAGRARRRAAQRTGPPRPLLPVHLPQKDTPDVKSEGAAVTGLAHYNHRPFVTVGCGGSQLPMSSVVLAFEVDLI
jgi:hypothetical protein